MSAARLFLLLGAVYGLLGVGLGAFGAHALKDRLTPEMLAVYHTGIDYQLWHALALLAVGILCAVRPMPGLGIAGWCFAAGVLLFSGSLYGLALSGAKWLGPVTPAGGLLLLAGWSALIRAVWSADQ